MSVYYIRRTPTRWRRASSSTCSAARTTKNLIEVKGFTSEAHGRAYDPPPRHVEGRRRFSFGCEYVNQRSQAVGWGFGDQEMCELLGFADASRAFESKIDRAEPAGEDDGSRLFSGPCSTTAFPWDHQKPGGPGPMSTITPRRSGG